MITAVDTSILLDLLGPDPVFGPASANALRVALAEGSLVACEVVWAEVAGMFPSSGAAEKGMSRLGLGFSAVTPGTAFEAGQVWKAYRERGGPRMRIAAKFLIGAHALLQADRLLARDRGFYRTYFKRLPILDPAKL
ncbi:MAG TPA: type II toxin-antitoxin system VapC family toxin [Terriglobia bacterium]|nr:type II toxin-antitoxin system VapC family toxin [Terriglobia bacterium]